MSSADPRTSSSRRRGAARRTPDGPRASFAQLLPFITEHRGTLAVVVVLSIAGAAMSLAQPLLLNTVIANVRQGLPLDGLVGAIIALVVVGALVSGFQHYLLQRTGTSVVFSARRRLVHRILRLPIAEFDLRRSGDLVSRVGTDTTLLYAVMTQGLLDAVGATLLFVGALIGMLIMDPVLFGLTLLVVAVALITVIALAGNIRKATARQQDKVGDLSAAIERAISAIRTVRAANATEREAAAVEEEARGAWRAGLDVARYSAFVVPVAGVAMQLSFLVVIGVGGFRVASGAIQVENLVSFILFLFMMIMPLGQAFGAITSVNQALGALGRIQEVLALPDETDHDAVITQAPRTAAPSTTAAPVAAESAASALGPAPGAPAIEFADVRFSYPEGAGEGGTSPHASRSGADREVLRGVTFQVPRGHRVALVGPSGAGKSTILALIERFYDPTAGAVRLDGVDLRALDRRALRAQLGYVEQDAPALAGSLRDNLVLGRPDATDEECIDVLRTVNLGTVLDRNAAGLDAQVGENGIMLSGGERQRLAIARALLGRAPILLLDEATSSLDGANEQLLREAIDAAAATRTLLVIAHRLSTVVDSDHIVVLDRGQVIGQGTHEELLETTPLYRELAEHQLLV